MIHPIPSGTRDVLPDEMRELRAITDALHATFEQYGYGEVRTPAIEYEEVLRRGGVAAREHLLVLERRRGDLAVAARVEHAAHRRLDRAQLAHLVGQHVAGP